MRRFIGLVAATMLLAGCATPSGEPSAPEDAVDRATLVELRKEYGLPDCPDTDPEADAVDGGLPKTDLPCLGSERDVNLAGLPRKPMVVNVWAQWCPPCREEAPILRQVSEAHDDVIFLGINYNDPQPDWALEFASLAKWSYPHVQDMDKTLQSSLRVPGLPVTLLVDADGRIVHTHPGVLTSEEQLEQLIEEHL